MVCICVNLERPLLKAAQQLRELRALGGQVLAASGGRAEANVVLQHLEDGLALYDTQDMELMPGPACLLHFLSDRERLQGQMNLVRILPSRTPLQKP